MIDVLVWNKYTRVVMQLAERLNISPEKALHLFYNSKVYALLLNKQYPYLSYNSNNPVVTLNSTCSKSLYLYIYSQLSNPFFPYYSVSDKGI